MSEDADEPLAMPFLKEGQGMTTSTGTGADKERVTPAGANPDSVRESIHAKCRAGETMESSQEEFKKCLGTGQQEAGAKEGNISSSLVNQLWNSQSKPEPEEGLHCGSQNHATQDVMNDGYILEMIKMEEETSLTGSLDDMQMKQSHSEDSSSNGVESGNFSAVEPLFKGDSKLKLQPPVLNISVKKCLLQSAAVSVQNVLAELEPICTFTISSEEEVQAWRKDVITVLEKDVDEQGWTLLHFLVGGKGADDTNAFGHLLATGMRTDSRTREGLTAAHLCAIHGRPQCLQLLKECRLDLSQRTRYGLTPSHYARKERDKWETNETEKGKNETKMERANENVETPGKKLDKEQGKDEMEEDKADEIEKEGPKKAEVDAYQDVANSGSTEGNTTAQTVVDENKDEFKKATSSVLQILDDYEATSRKRASESLASLAKRGRFYSVQSLIRRGLFVLGSDEFDQKEDGKTAEEWAREGDRHDVADEIKFWQWRFKNIDSIVHAASILKSGLDDGDVPKFVRPMSTPLHMQASVNYQGELKKALEPYACNFAVTSRERFWKLYETVISPFETELKFENGWNSVQQSVGNLGSNDADFLGLLLAVGVNPDRPNKNYRKASHLAAMNARPLCLELLLECRVDLKNAVLSPKIKTVLDFATKYRDKAEKGLFPWTKKEDEFDEYVQEDKDAYLELIRHVVEILTNAKEKMEQGQWPEPLASLARRGRFYSLHNLLRRPGTLPQVEFVKKHNGLTAKQWVIEHGRHDIALEIEFWEKNHQDTGWVFKSLPDLKTMTPLDINCLGDKRNWPELRHVLQPYVSRPILSEADDKILQKIQSAFERARYRKQRWAAVHDMLGNDGGDDTDMFGMLAAIGSDLDLVIDDGSNWRPIHLAASNARADSTQILIDCRVDLGVKQRGLLMAMGLAKAHIVNSTKGIFPWTKSEKSFANWTEEDKENFPGKARRIVEMLEQATKTKHDSLAKLAKRKAFCAMQYLMRRRPSLLHAGEYTETLEGKTAEQWALENGRKDIADELRYRRNILNSSTANQDLAGFSKVQPTYGTKFPPLVHGNYEVERMDIPLFQLGGYAFRDTLKELLATYKGASVTSAKDEADMRRLVHEIQANIQEKTRWNIIHVLVGNSGNDDRQVLAEVLALGLDPDAVCNDGWASVHLCATNARIECLRELIDCRANLFLKTTAGVHALGFAEMWLYNVNRGKFPWSGGSSGFEHWTKEEKDAYTPNLKAVISLLRKARVSDVRPTLAQLAREGNFCAIRSILRRSYYREVDAFEFNEVCGGKDAQGWASEYGYHDIGDEINYWKNKDKSASAPRVALQIQAEFERPEFPVCPELHDGITNLSTLGQKHHWDNLRKICWPFANFSVLNKEDDGKLLDVTRKLDAAKQGGVNGWANVHDLVGNFGADDKEMLGLYMSLGVDPEATTDDESTALHICVAHERPDCLRLLLLCRANVHALDSDGDTPGVMAARRKQATQESVPAELLSLLGKKKEGSKVEMMCNYLENALSAAAPVSLAELVKQNEIYAALHVLRRPSVDISITEYFEDIEGGDAWAWALKAGRVGLAMEIRYRRYRALAEAITAEDGHEVGKKLETQAGLVWTMDKHERTLETLFDFCFWLIEENPCCLSEKVKRYIEQGLPRWQLESGGHCDKFVHHWFNHVNCERAPGMQEEHNHVKLLQEFIKVAQEVQASGDPDYPTAHTTPEKAWFIWNLLTHVVRVRPEQWQTRRSEERPAGFWAWMDNPDIPDHGHNLGVFAELLDACWIQLSPVDWHVIDLYFETLRREATASNFSMLPSAWAQRNLPVALRNKVLRAGFPVQMSSQRHASILNPESVGRFSREGLMPEALCLLRQESFHFKGTLQTLERDAPDGASADMLDVRRRHDFESAKAAIRLQMARAVQGRSIALLAKEKDWNTLQTMVRMERISVEDLSEKVADKNAAEWCKANDNPELSAVLNGLMRQDMIDRLGGKTIAEHARDCDWDLLTKVLKEPKGTNLKASDIMEISSGRNVMSWCAYAGRSDLAERFQKLLPKNYKAPPRLDDSLGDILEDIECSGATAFYQVTKENRKNLIQQVMDPTFRIPEVRKEVLEEFRRRDPDGFQELVGALTINDALDMEDPHLTSLLLLRSATVTTAHCNVALPLRGNLTDEQLQNRRKFFPKEPAAPSGQQSDQAGQKVEELLYVISSDKSPHIAFARKHVTGHPVMALWTSTWWKHGGFRQKHTSSAIVFIAAILIAIFNCIAVSIKPTALGPLQSPILTLATWALLTAHVAMVLIMHLYWDVTRFIPTPFNNLEGKWQNASWFILQAAPILASLLLSDCFGLGLGQKLTASILTSFLCPILGVALLIEICLPTDTFKRAMIILQECHGLKNITIAGSLLINTLFLAHILLKTSLLGAGGFGFEFMELQVTLILLLLNSCALSFTILNPDSVETVSKLQVEKRMTFMHKLLRESRLGRRGDQAIPVARSYGRCIQEALLKALQMADEWAKFFRTSLKGIWKALNEGQETSLFGKLDMEKFAFDARQAGDKDQHKCDKQDGLTLDPGTEEELRNFSKQFFVIRKKELNDLWKQPSPANVSLEPQDAALKSEATSAVEGAQFQEELEKRMEKLLTNQKMATQRLLRRQFKRMKQGLKIKGAGKQLADLLGKGDSDEDEPSLGALLAGKGKGKGLKLEQLKKMMASSDPGGRIGVESLGDLKKILSAAKAAGIQVVARRGGDSDSD